MPIASLRYAAFGQRLAASLIDWAVLPLPLSIAAYFLGDRAGIAWMILQAVVFGVAFLGYQIGLHYRFGATLGKLVAKARVVADDGGASRSDRRPCAARWTSP